MILPAGESASVESPYVEVRETHSGVVLLMGDRAYKAKKPVVTRFLDFGTHALRELACTRELALNQRLAPDVYIGVAHLTDPSGGPSEPVLVMRRMPESLRLSTMVARGVPVDSSLRALAQLMADFHANARRGRDVDSEGAVDALRARWQSNLRETRELSEGVLPADSVDRVERLAMQYLDGRGPLFAQRIARGRIVDGHADLIADDVFCLPDGPRVLDCLDFDDRLRFVDCLDDVAFLAMDLEYLGRPDLARAFLDCYSGIADDAPPSSLVDHYLAYRAFVRAKVDCLRHTQGATDSAGNAVRHTAIAIEHLERGAVRLGIVGGLPGTGKSTLSAALAGRVGAVVISSDGVRKELQTAGAIDGEAGRYGAGLYAPQSKALVYATMLERAQLQLEAGRSVILDASWTDGSDRDRAAALAAATGSILIPLRCAAPRSLAANRIRGRDRGLSEATPEIADSMARSTPCWPAAFEIDTTATPDESVVSAAKAWQHPRRAGWAHI